MGISFEEEQARQARKKPSSPAYPKSIILDKVNPKDLRELQYIFCCEQCSYFDSKKASCAMGFRTEYHQRANQIRLFELTGRMAFCRSQEVD